MQKVIDLNGEGRIRKVGDTFTYDYYVKDHLGSTREVINDEGAVTEATMYYPYGTMETLLKPPVNDNAREKFTGKELDAGENPASEVSFNIAINNVDAGMHYHGELYVNYTDLVYNRSFLKVYPLQYDADADRFILNTADRFPDSMRVTNLRIATSGAVSPINYEKACDYTVITDSGLTIALDTSGSALINSSGVNYFTDSPYTPERVAGSNLYYFGARYYDAELGVWGSTDRAGQYFNSYAYPNNPVLTVDPNGNFALAAAIVSAVISSAIANVKVIIEGYNNHWSAAEFGWNFCWQTNVYGNIGFISGLAGGEIGTAVSGWVGAGTLGGATAGGAAAGAVSAAASYTGNYAVDVAFKGQEWNSEQFWSGLGWQTLIGGSVGGVLGGLTELTSGEDVGQIIYEPGSEGDGTVADIKSGRAHIKEIGHSSHLKMVYTENGAQKSLSWGGVRNNFNDVRIGSDAKSFLATGLKADKITSVGNSLRNTNYNWMTNNCGQNVAKSVFGIKMPAVTPTTNYNFLQLRQAWMNILSL